MGPQIGLLSVLERDLAPGAVFRIQCVAESLPRLQLGDPLLTSGLIEILLHLRFLCRLSEKLGKALPTPEAFSPCAEYETLEALIKFFRDGVCHAHIWNHRFENRPEMHLGIHVATWKGWATKIGGKTLESEFENEVTMFIGHHRM